MRCPDCHGTGKLTCRLNGTPCVYPLLHCNACQGSGIASCCDAAGSAQPEPDKREDERMPVRLQRRRTKGWLMPDGAIYVGRPSKWGNPFKVGDLYKIDDTPRFRLITADFAVDLFRRDLLLRPSFRADILRELRGRDLVCWCPLDKSCHADVLLEIANG